MKAELSVPSPNILLKRFGIVNARINASPIADTPKQVKKRTSRKRPRNLEAIVSPLTREILLARLVMLKRLHHYDNDI